MDNSIVTATTTITVDGQGKPVSATTEVTVPKLNKSFSEPNLDKYGSKAEGVYWVVCLPLSLMCSFEDRPFNLHPHFFFIIIQKNKTFSTFRH